MHTIKFYRKFRVAFTAVICLLNLGLSMASATGQTGLIKTVTIKGDHLSISDIFDYIKKETGLTVFYGDQLLNDQEQISVNFKSTPLNEVLNFLLRNKGIGYSLRRDRVIVLERIQRSQDIQIQKPISQAKTQQVISGKVSDMNGPLAGVSIIVKGTTRGTTTNGGGNYSIRASANEILVFNIMGYTSQEINVGPNRDINVTLQATAQDLNEIVVIGYGTVRKRDLTGSVSQVKAKEVNAFPNANIIQSLSGRAAGVQIRQSSGAPGPSMSMRIRGGNSILGSNEPLYVIDGFPISGNSPNPSHINVTEVESVEVLKDASATAIYGSRGANGVVLITTKRGKAGQTGVNFETSFSNQKLIRKLNLMDAKEYALFYNEQRKNDGESSYFSQTDIDGFGKGFDWQDFVFQNAPMSNSAINVNGGNERTQFSVSGSIFDQDGIIKGSDYKRYSLQSSLNHKISNKFSFELTSTLSRLITERKDSGGGSRGNSMIAAAISAPPTLSPYNDDGSYRVLSTAYPFIATDIINPINFINERSNKIIANSYLINGAVNYRITTDLTLKVAGGIENRDERTDSYITREYFNSTGVAGVSSTQLTSLLNENTLNYNKIFHEKHSVSAVLGFSYQNFVNTSFSAGGIGYLSDIFQSYKLQVAETPNVPTSSYNKSVILSFLGRLNYSYDDRYLATVSLRRDGSSRYSKGDQWGYFPSGALAWRISSEKFLKGNPIISDLKIRTSWGLTGSQAIDPYKTLNILDPGKIILDNDYANTFAPGTDLPGKLKWEKTEQLNAGFDLGLFKNRFILTADYYIKNTRDLLSVVTLPSSMGYTSTMQNVGKIRNKGVELSLDSRIFDKAFTWNLSGNIAFNRSKVIDLYNDADLLRDQVGAIIVNDVTSILRVGQPVGRFWGYQEYGYDEKGNIIFKDISGDGSVSAVDKTYIGDPNPNFIYGLNSTMTYKNFEFSFFFQGMQGNDIFNASAISNTMDYGFGLNMTKDVYNNHWTPEIKNPDYPRISKSTPVRISNRFIEDGSYLRLKNIMLAYHLPIQSFGWNWVKSLQVYASGQNLWTVTDYSWWDPEANFRLDNNSYPLAKSITFGLKADF
ncbi:TonB-linked outer membrane protein, SusC/RagA family [bacterium A37T11]|nr:TonB-linked outer membrane protein, SusC/RagA family [bacterium A37T11]